MLDEVEFQLCRVNQSAFTAFCVDFLRCTDFFYYIIIYVVREVVTGKMRNLQKSIEKVTLCTEKSFEKVAISTKTRLKNAKSAKIPLKKSNGCKIRLKNHLPFFVYVLLSFVFMKITD